MSLDSTGGDHAAGSATDADATLALELDVDLNPFGFGGGFETNVGLRDLLGLPKDAVAMAAWLPNIGIKEAGFVFRPDPAKQSFALYVVAGIAGSSTSSATFFLATMPTPVAISLTTGAPPTPATSFVVGLGLTSTVDLGATPLFGSMLSGIALQGLGIDYASHALKRDAFTLPPPAPQTQPEFPQGLVMTLTIAGGGSERTFTMQPSSKSPPNKPSRATLVPRRGVTDLSNGPRRMGDQPSDDQPPMQWFTLQRSFGPLTIGRLGLLTTDERFGLGLDASVLTSAFSVVLSGFMITFPTDRIDLANTHVQLDGLALSFSSPSVSLDGSLVRKVTDKITEYNGAVLIQLGQFGIAAVGAYADLHGSPSLFIYGMAKGAFGGPPAFFVTGVAAGFGYNRSLRLPTPETVADHPFVLASQSGADFTKALALLTDGGWVPPSAGDYWLAAGIQFTTFEVMRSFVLLTVQFGHELVFAILGISAIKLPQVGPTYAYAELTLDVVLRPSAGTFQLTALLTPNSYLLDPACHLTGGFAFYLWFGDNDHSGDFVVTLGGFHPLFEPPPWYPTIPRLGFDWNVSDTVHFTGGVYFALTPSCVMAGGALSLTFHSGDLRAWFTAHVDLLIYWKPFYFVAGIGLSLGASYTLNLGSLHRTFTIELGVDLELWGPPVAGVAHVSWFIISFTIAINGGGQPSPPGRVLKDWDTFAKQFLPPPTSPPALDAVEVSDDPPAEPATICRPRATRGLLRMIEHDTVWVVAASELVVETETVIPATEIAIGRLDAPTYRFTGPAAGVYPMGSVALSSSHFVEIDRFVANGTSPVPLETWRWRPRSGSQPQSLWGRENTGEPALGADTVPVLSGSVGSPEPPPVTGPGAISFKVLAYVDLSPERPLPLPRTPPIDGATNPTPDPFTIVEQTVMSPAVVTRRDAIVAELVTLGIGRGLVGGDLSRVRDEVRATFAAPPMIGPLGSTGPRTQADEPSRVVRPSGRARWRRPPPTPRSPTLVGAFRRHRVPGLLATPTHEPLGTALLRAATTAPQTHRQVPPGERVLTAGAAARRMPAEASFGTDVAADLTAVWVLDPARPHTMTTDGPSRRVLAFDDQHLLLADTTTERGELMLPAGTALVVLDEMSSGPRAVGQGWSATSRLRQVGAHLCLGDGVMVRTQSPRRVRRGRGTASCGLVTGAALVADNLVAVGDLGVADAEPGWLDTIVPAGSRTAVVALFRSANLPEQDASPATVSLARGGVPRHDSLTRRPRLAATLDDVDATHLVVDLDAALPDADEPIHVFVAPGRGWCVQGVAVFTATPSAVLADRSRPPATTEPSLRPSAPTFVQWQ